MKNFTIGLDKQTLIEEVADLLAVSQLHKFDDIITKAIVSSLVANSANQGGINLISKIPVDGDIVFLDSEHNETNGLSLTSLKKPIYFKFRGTIKLKKDGSEVKDFNFQPDISTLVSFKTQQRHYFDESLPFKPNIPFIQLPVIGCSYYSQYQFNKLSNFPRQEDYMPSAISTFGMNTNGSLIKSQCSMYGEEFSAVEPIEYSNFAHLLFSIKELKTQINLEIISATFKVDLSEKLNQLNTDILASIKDKMFPISYFAFDENTEGSGVRFGITYYRSMLTGNNIACGCATKYLNHTYNALIASELTTSSTYNLVKYLKEHTRPRICHLCVIEDTDLKTANALYGTVSHYDFSELTDYYKSITSFSELSWVYSNLEVVFKETKWINEHKVFTLARELLPKERVIREGSPNWLNRQRFDVYFPKLNMAIEYQGKQHFESIDYFGGDEALARNQERDKRKALLCKENGVHLIYIDYRESVSKTLMKRKLAKYL